MIETEEIFLHPIVIKKDYVTFFTEVICCILFIIVFISIGLYSESAHIFFTLFKSSLNNQALIPLGSLLLILSISVSFLMILGHWMKIDWFGTLLQKTRLTDRRIILIGLTAAICISVVPLFISWGTANPYYSSIGGLIPYSDAVSYYQGAEQLLDTGKLDSWSQRRPINAILFAERLLVTNFNFRNALILQAIFFGISAFLAAFAVGRTFGKMSGFLVFFGLFLFATPYIPLTLSETLGISLGSLGFALLWYGVSDRHRAAFLMGMVVLTLALVTRAGAMFVLPALILVSGYLFRNKGQIYNLGQAAIAAICTGAGFFINQVILWLYGDGTGTALSNFSYVIYGIAAGGKGWTQIYSDYPQQMASLGSEAAISGFIYQKSFENILSNPIAFLQTLLNLLIFDFQLLLYQITQYLFLFDNSGSIFQMIISNSFLFVPHILFLILLIISFLGAVRFFVLCQNSEIKLFLLVCLSGCILSLPFFYLDGGLRLTAATFPFIVMGIVIIFLGLLPRACFSKIQKNSVQSKSFRFLQFILPATMSAIIIISAVFGPMIFPHLATALTNPPKFSQTNSSCTANQESIVMRIDSGMPYLLIHDKKYQQPTFSPDIQENDIKFINWDNDPNFDPFFSVKHGSPFLFVLGYDQKSHEFMYLYDNNTFFVNTSNERRFMNICTEQDSNTTSFVRIVKSSSIIDEENK